MQSVRSRRCPEGDPHVLDLSVPTQFVDVRDYALVVGRDLDFETNWSLGSGVGERLVSGSGHDAAFWLKRIGKRK